MNTAIAFRPLASMALLVAGAVGPWLPAEAARYVGRFDPVYGAPFTNPDVFWSGEIDVTTSDACASSAGSVSSTFLVGACTMVINSASVTFSTVNVGPPASAGTVIDTLDFTGGGVVASMQFNGTDAGPPANPGVKQLVGVNAFPLGPVLSTHPNLQFPQGGSGTQAYFSLAFLGSKAQLYWFQNDPGPAVVVIPPSGIDSSNLNNFNPCQATYNTAFNCGWSSAEASQGANIIFTPVPEPEAYGLALAGAAVVGFSMLRRRKPRQLIPD